jgi:1,4-dihydroxy-2-naphthoyl-CoA hydrolase
MAFTYTRTIHLADTDAAGVVYFARTLSLCHEAYEEALAAAGVNLGALLGPEDVIVPISKSEAEYLRPLRSGDKVRISVTPEPLSENSFAVQYQVVRLGAVEKLAARVRTEHVSTSIAKRERVALPAKLAAWVSGKA